MSLTMDNMDYDPQQPHCMTLQYNQLQTGDKVLQQSFLTIEKEIFPHYTHFLSRGF